MNSNVSSPVSSPEWLSADTFSNNTSSSESETGSRIDQVAQQQMRPISRTSPNFSSSIRPSAPASSIPSVSTDAHRSTEISSYVFLGDNGKLYEISYRVQTPNGPLEKCIATKEIWESHAEQLRKHHRIHRDLLTPGCDKDIKLEKDPANNEFYLIPQSGNRQGVSKEFKNSYFAIPTYKGGLREASALVSNQDNSSIDLTEDENPPILGTLSTQPHIEPSGSNASSKADLNESLPQLSINSLETLGNGTARRGNSSEDDTDSDSAIFPPIIRRNLKPKEEEIIELTDDAPDDIRSDSSLSKNDSSDSEE